MWLKNLLGRGKEEKKDEVWHNLTKILDLVNIEIRGLKKEVDIINAKLRSRFYRKDQGKDNEDGSNEDSHDYRASSVDDGLDELRNLRKTL